MRSAPHTALPRVKGMHQPRDSAVFFLKTNNHSGSARPARKAYSERAQAVKGGKVGGGSSSLHSAPPLSPPACAPLLVGVGEGRLPSGGHRFSYATTSEADDPPAKNLKPRVGTDGEGRGARQ